MSTIRECSAAGGGGAGGGGLGTELKVQYSCAKRFECCYKFRWEQISQQNQQEEEEVVNKIKLERQSRHLYTHRATTNKFNSKKWRKVVKMSCRLDGWECQVLWIMLMATQVDY